MYSNDICFFPLGERHFVSQLVTSLFFRSVLLFIFLTPLFSQNLIIDKDNKVLINNKKQGYFARKILSFNGQPLILTYHQGIKYFDKSKMIDIPVPINPVFNRPRQIESFWL